MLSQHHKQRTHRYNKPISVTTFWFALMNLRPTALKPYHMNNCHQWSQLKLHFSKFHNIQEYRMRLQNNFGCNIYASLVFLSFHFYIKILELERDMHFASCHNCGFSVCNLIIDFLPAQPGELSEICRKPKLYIPGMYMGKTKQQFEFSCIVAFTLKSWLT